MLISIGNNRKLSPGRIAVFNLPANKEVCGRECVGCYAKKAQIYPVVRSFRARALRASRGVNFVDRVAMEIGPLVGRLRALRVHESGEFYSQDYVNKWVEISQRIPRLMFYTYTKRKGDLDFSVLESRPNFVVINSLLHGINFGGKEVVKIWKDRGAKVCPAHNGKVSCGHGCNYCLTKAAQETGVVFWRH